MRKYAVLVFFSIFLVLSYQNCGKPPGTMDLNSNSSAHREFNKYSVESFPLLSIWDFNRNRFLDLDLKTGQIVAYEQAGQVKGETFELSQDKLFEVQTILDQAEVCDPIVKSEDREGRVCAMAYRYPYAVLVEQGHEIRLGEKADSCDIPVDLCEPRAKQLRNWATEVVNSLEAN